MSPPPVIPGYTISWSDDFTGVAGTLPNTNNWIIVSAGPNYGNNEVETYTNSPTNVSLSGQNTLQITPVKEVSGNWTSARLESIPYFACPAGGRMILQASLQTGTSPQADQAGIWPAFWALGASIRSGTSWPECGEWDVMENAHGVDWTLASLHYGPDGNQANEQTAGGGVGSNAQYSFPAGQFNTFALTVDRTATTWENETLTWSLNGTSWFTVTGSQVNNETLWANCAQKAYYAILNVAVGSNFPQVGGKPDDLTVSGLGSGMQVQYVAFYQSITGGKQEVVGAGKGGGSQRPIGPEGARRKEEVTKKPVEQGQAAVAGTATQGGAQGKKRNRLSQVLHRVFD